MTCWELLITLDLSRPAIVSMMVWEGDWSPPTDYLLASTASGLDLHSTSSGRIRDRQCSVTFAHIRTLSCIDVAFSQDAGILAAAMANVRSRCAWWKDAPYCSSGAQ